MYGNRSNQGEIAAKAAKQEETAMANERNRMFVRIFIDSDVGHYTFYVGQFKSQAEKEQLEKMVSAEFSRTSLTFKLTNYFKETIEINRNYVMGYHIYNAVSVPNNMESEHE